jgi:hypothetical protein
VAFPACSACKTEPVKEQLGSDAENQFAAAVMLLVLQKSRVFWIRRLQ